MPALDYHYPAFFARFTIYTIYTLIIRKSLSLHHFLALGKFCGMVLLISVHPETPDETLLVSNSETRDFSSWQGNRGVARRRTLVRRTSKPED
jgi:hypothetical protein